MTNRDKKDSIRGRMADTGEPFNVARRKVEAAAADDLLLEGEDPYQLIEVEVGTDDPGRPPNPRHFETFWGRWIIAPDPAKRHKVAYYGVAQTPRGRIAVYRGLADPDWEGEAQDYPSWVGELNDYDTLADAEMPEDLRRKVAAALGVREVIHRDI